MKKNYNLFFILVTLLVFSVSCRKSELDGGEGSPIEEEEVVAPDAEDISFSISLSSEEGKATIASGKVTWDEGDQVTVYGIPAAGEKQHQTVTVSDISGDGKTAKIQTTNLSPGLTYYAVFPKCTTATISDDIITVSEPVAATAQTNSNNQIAVAKAVKVEGGYSLQFRNVNHLLKFTVSSALAGTVKSAELVSQTPGGAVSYDQVKFNFTEETSAYAGTEVTSVKRTVVEGDNYIALAPGMTLSDGFCLLLKDKDGKIVKLFFLDSKFTTKRNGVSNISDFENRLYTNLSKDETANCYLINPPGTNGNKLFCFDATVKGNGVGVEAMSDSFRDPKLSTADVTYLWSTYNTTNVPADEQKIVSSFSYHKAGYASFEYVRHGNVIVAAKDSSREIIWSWHLWLPMETVENVVHTNADEGRNMLNANLGALKTAYTSNSDVRDLGFFYQWGRKDPFVSATKRTISDPKTIEYVAVHGVQKTFMNRGATKSPSDNLAYVIANPTAFMVSKDRSGTEMYTQDYKDWYDSNTHYPFWALKKTMYDPCPPGYKVPRVQGGPWKGLSTGSSWANYGRSFKNTSGVDIWHPAAGFLHRCSGKYSGSKNSLGVNGGYWGTDDDAPVAARGYKEYNHHWYFDSSGCAFNYDQSGDTNAGRATGRSVRCCRADEFL